MLPAVPAPAKTSRYPEVHASCSWWVTLMNSAVMAERYATSSSAPGLSDAEAREHRLGDAGFEAVFVTPPAIVNSGLGPVFNNTSCAGCHQGDGRGMPVMGQGPLGSGMLVRVSTPDGAPVPGLGSQLQDHAVSGTPPEVVFDLRWKGRPGSTGTARRTRSGAPRLWRRPA